MQHPLNWSLRMGYCPKLSLRDYNSWKYQESGYYCYHTLIGLNLCNLSLLTTTVGSVNNQGLVMSKHCLMSVTWAYCPGNVMNLASNTCLYPKMGDYCNHILIGLNLCNLLLLTTTVGSVNNQGLVMSKRCLMSMMWAYCPGNIINLASNTCLCPKMKAYCSDRIGLLSYDNYLNRELWGCCFRNSNWLNWGTCLCPKKRACCRYIVKWLS